MTPTPTPRPTPETDNLILSCGGWGPTNHEWREHARDLERERDEAREELQQWKMLCAWGGTPEHIDQFIKGQQSRIHQAQDIEETCEQLERERDEARDQLKAMERAGAEQARRADENREWALRAERERDEALAKLSTVYRWIERNHSDGFIDSQSHLQNLDRVADAWHDKLEAMREAISTFAKLQPFLAHE